MREDFPSACGELRHQNLRAQGMDIRMKSPFILIWIYFRKDFWVQKRKHRTCSSAIWHPRVSPSIYPYVFEVRCDIVSLTKACRMSLLSFGTLVDRIKVWCERAVVYLCVLLLVWRHTCNVLAKPLVSFCVVIWRYSFSEPMVATMRLQFLEQSNEHDADG